MGHRRLPAGRAAAHDVRRREQPTAARPSGDLVVPGISSVVVIAGDRSLPSSSAYQLWRFFLAEGEGRPLVVVPDLHLLLGGLLDDATLTTLASPLIAMPPFAFAAPPVPFPPLALPLPVRSR